MLLPLPLILPEAYFSWPSPTASGVSSNRTA